MSEDILANCAVKIAVRERPAAEMYKNKEQSVIKYASEKPNVIIVDGRAFAFDYVLDPAVTQQALFEDLILPLVTKVKEGFNCTALAYGQTGTGKSYTMGLNCENFAEENAGIVSRCLQEFFSTSDTLSDETISPQEPENLTLCASYIEIYNEKVYDLLSDTFAEPIVARGYKFTGGSRLPLASIDDCRRILLQSNKNRHVRPTTMNSQSTRSHAIFSIHVCNRRDGRVTSSCLNLVDLAGSEGIRRTGHQGVALSEGVQINKGLLSIGKVLQALATGQKCVPYRDSVLSLVLQDSFNPRSYLTLLACVSPHRNDLSETLFTLRFAQNAKNLKHSPLVNILHSAKKKSISRTPFKANSAHNVGAIKRPYSSIYSTNKFGLNHQNATFDSPSKVRALHATKNLTMAALTPKEKKKVHERLLLPRPSAPAALRQTKQLQVSQLNFDTARSLLFEQTCDSQVCSFDEDISSSTLINGRVPQLQPNAAAVNFSPMLRQCMTAIEGMMKSVLNAAVSSMPRQSLSCYSQPLP